MTPRRDTAVRDRHVCAVDHDHAAASFTPIQRAMLRAVRWYQRAFAWRPSPCRFFPSCSAYAVEAIEVHGARRGGWLTLRRLSRCRPLGPSGVDLVPERASSSPAQKGG